MADRVQQITAGLAAAGIGGALLIGGVAYAQDRTDQADTVEPTTVSTATTPTGSTLSESWPSVTRGNSSSGATRSSGS